jgi:hypothetical protein
MRTINRTGLETYFITMRKENERESQISKREEEKKRCQENFKNGDGGALLKVALNSELSPCPTQTLIP